jgi:restriction system protein
MQQLQLRDYDAAHRKWASLNEQCRTKNDQARVAWDRGRQQFETLRAADIARLGQLKNAYFEQAPNAIIMHTQLVQLRSPYPATFPRSVEAAYDPETRIVVIDYELPNVEGLVMVKPIPPSLVRTSR